MSYLLLKGIHPGVGQTDYAWDYILKAVSVSSSGSVGPLYSRDPSEMIDAYNISPTIVRKVYHDGAGGVTFVDVPNAVALYIIVVSEIIGIPRLFSTGVYNYFYYDIISRSVIMEAIIYTLSFTYSYSKTTSDEIDSYCLGTTKKQIYHDGVGGVTDIITPNSTDCGFIIPSEGLQITEKLRVKIDNSCHKNPIYLKWKNSIGGWDQWLFHTDQLFKLKTTSLGTFEVNFTDLENQDTISESRGKQASESIILGADDLTEDDVEGIKEIYFSPKVYMITQDLKQVTVEVVEGSFNIKESNNPRQTVELEIILPEIFTITQ